MTEFKVGDRVRVRPGLGQFDPGGIRTVQEVGKHIGLHDPDEPNSPWYYEPEHLEHVKPPIAREELVEAASRQMCAISGRDPEELIPVQPYPGCVVDAAGNANVPLWETVTSEVRNFLIITEAVKAALVAHGGGT